MSEAYETRDARAGAILGLGVALALLIGVVMLVTAWMYRSLSESRQAAQPEPSPVAVDPGGDRRTGPKLQADPTSELEALRARERQHLEGYRWIDREAGVVQLPIERAMDLVGSEGLPHREKDR